MSLPTIPFECDAVRSTFSQWHAEQEPLEQQLSESLAALEAYQSHLDEWQQQLAGEREQVRLEREQARLEREEVCHERERLDEERTAAQAEQAQASAAAADELRAAQEKIAALTDDLLTRTEELRELEQRRAEIAAQLEETTAREQASQAALEELRQTHDHERTQWEEELHTLQGLLESHAAASSVAAPATDRPPALAPSPTNTGCEDTLDSPVLASIAQQFSKLRRQRSSDRAIIQKTR